MHMRRKQMKFKRKQWTPQTLNEMLQLYRDGVAIENLSKKYKVTPDAIRQQASKAHVYRSGEHLSRVRREARAYRKMEQKNQHKFSLASSKPTDFISVHEAASFLGLSVKTIRRWIEKGKFSHYRFGRNVRINVVDFLTFIKSSKANGGRNE